MSGAERVVREKFEISAATPRNSQISVLNELNIVLKNQTEVEGQNELEETAEKQEKAAEAEEKLSTPQKAEKDEGEVRGSSEESLEDLKRSKGGEIKNLDSEVHTFNPSYISDLELRAQLKINQLEIRDSEDGFGRQERWGDTDDLNSSSLLSCLSFENLRRSILTRDRSASTLSLNSLIGLDLEQTSSRYSSTVSMKGRSLSLTRETSDREIGCEICKNGWPYFKSSQIDEALAVFKQVGVDKYGFITLGQLKRFFEILDVPQTHIKTKKMMAHVVGVLEDRLNFSEVLLIYGNLMHRLVPLKWRLQRRRKWELANNDAVDVAQVGVSGAKRFFETKIARQTRRGQSSTRR